MAGEASLSLVALRSLDILKHDKMKAARDACVTAGVPIPKDVEDYLERIEMGEDGDTLVSWYDYDLRIGGYRGKPKVKPVSEHGRNPQCVRYSLQELVDAGFDSIEFRSGGDY